jgi:hypothetical protein
LDGAKALFPQPFTKDGQALKIEIKQISRHACD